ncbi:MAG: UDP-N-acetyl-D-glucosamine 6-dehydrogenase [Candidatus Latescibacteria bacterium ADurb.Bin168]|nr:MAG: UDP-N-acetyl-D-glucosamine 6-dehydrogenase [Candidatus Latescibacteria bacterium ADurb.Bin168]
MMPHYVTTKVIVALNRQKKCVNGSKILVLGVSYKKDVEDVREAPAVHIIKELWRKFALVTYCDPHVRSLSIGGRSVERVEFTDEALREADCVLILTDHTAFDFDRVAEKSRLIVDTRNAITRRDLSHVYHL